jgi:hypothetical protein
MRHNALALSESAMELVRRAAARLPTERRAVFLQGVAARLGEGAVSFHAVELAIEGALGAAAPAFELKGPPVPISKPREEAKP